MSSPKPTLPKEAARLARRSDVRSELTRLVSEVVAVWRTTGDLTDQTSLRMGEIAERFARRMTVIGIGGLGDVDETLCRGFIDAPTRTGTPPTNATRHFRRVTLRALFRTARNLGYTLGDPTLDISLPLRSQRSTRPLTTEEILLCRTAAFAVRGTSLQRAAAWALAEAGATTSEIALIDVRHFDNPAEPTRVSLPGTRRVDPRTATLTGWGAAVLTQRLADTPKNTPVAYLGAGGEVARQAAICKLITIVLTESGLTDTDIKPDSIRLWRARAEYDLDLDLIAAARLLGNRSLDRTAEALDIVWRRP